MAEDYRDIKGFTTAVWKIEQDIQEIHCKPWGFERFPPSLSEYDEDCGFLTIEEKTVVTDTCTKKVKDMKLLQQNLKQHFPIRF